MSELITPMADLGMLILRIALSFVVVALFFSILEVRKTKKYRKQIVDMYVSSKTKKLAKEEGLDLEAEYECFKVWNKRDRRKREGFELDDAVEEDLMEKVGEEKKNKK